jgi:glycosyltransferase involved in cell wall biosynthesis
VKISIVTPSYQQGAFLEACIRSVLDQSFTDWEYIIIDGGSTDESPAILRKYQDRLASWYSGPDGGLYPAIEQGFARTSGEILAWLNSDDVYMPWTFRVVADIFEAFPDVEWITSRFPLVMNTAGDVVHAKTLSGFNREAFYRGQNIPLEKNYYTHFLSQESTFWRRRLWEKAGSKMDGSLRYAGDFELWARFFQHADVCAVSAPLAAFRLQSNQISGTRFAGYIEECASVLARYGRRAPGRWEGSMRHALRYMPPALLQRFPEGVVYPYRTIESKANSDRAVQWQLVPHRMF